MKFSDFQLNDNILKAIDEIGHTTPTEIQEKAIPILTEGSTDFVGQAQTGTGKTAAFVLPLLQNINPQSRDVQSLVLAPTRELANQVCNEVLKLGKYNKLKTLAIYGGTPYEKQVRGIKKDRPQIIVGTPGRVIDLMNQGILKLDQVKFMVLDEADEMLNMGFLDDVKEILSRVNKARTMWMFSATMSRNILNLIKEEFNEPKIVKIERKTLSNDDIEQKYFLVRRRNFMEALCRLLDSDSDIYGIVFCRTRLDTRDLADELLVRGYSVETLHGEMGQAARDVAMAKFKAKKSKIMVCTDVAARGIDVTNLTHVFNYGTPQDLESYVHRIGRTGRAGCKGTAITLLDPREEYWVNKMERYTGKKITKNSLPSVKDLKTNLIGKELEKMTSMFESVVEKGEEFSMDETFKSFSEYFESANKEEVLKVMFTWKFNRQLRHYNELGSLDEVRPSGRSGRDSRSRGGRDSRARGGRDSRGRGREADRDGRSNDRRMSSGGNNSDRRSNSRRSFTKDANKTRFFMNMGKDDGLNLKSLLDDVSKNAGINSSEIQNVDMKKQFSFFEVPKELGERVLKQKDLKINNRSVRLEYTK